MKEAYQAKPDIHSLVLGIFETAYAVDSNITIETGNDSESIDGIQANGYNIRLQRPVLREEENLRDSKPLIVSLNYMLRSDEKSVPNTYLREYALLLSGDVFGWMSRVPRAFINIGPGETQDIYEAVKGSDFTTPPQP